MNASMRASMADRAALRSANSSCRMASRPVDGWLPPSKRAIQIPSPSSRWFRVPWIEPKNAGRGRRYSSSDRPATASYRIRLAAVL